MTAAARRYSGTYKLPDGTGVGRVTKWIAWNEPNNPVFLKPQFVRVGRRREVGDAEPEGLRQDLQRRRQGGEGGQRREQGRLRRHLAAWQQPAGDASLVGLAARLPARDEACGREGVRRLRTPPVLRLSDRDAEHAAAPGKRGQPPTAVTLGNFELLTKELARLYGNMRIWVTEYGYQTNPPDKLFGVSPAKQALYMQQAWDKLAANPRVDMMIWFLLRDESRIGAGWQSGLFTVGGARKPSREIFERLVP